jgi:hypothetical protein
MNYPTHDTEWARSAKGNLWRRANGVLLVVGKRKSDSSFWARVGEDFLKGSFPTEALAKRAAESGVEADDSANDLDHDWLEGA